MKWRDGLIFSGFAVVILLGWSGVFEAKGHVPAGQAAFVELDPVKMDFLRQNFNDASDQVRVVILVSPT